MCKLRLPENIIKTNVIKNLYEITSFCFSINTQHFEFHIDLFKLVDVLSVEKTFLDRLVTRLQLT